MNPTNVLRLDKKIREMKTDIKMNRRPMSVLATDIGKTLGCKVSVGVLREVMMANGIETRRVKSKHALQIEALIDENCQLRALLAEVDPHAVKAPPHLLTRIKAAVAADQPCVATA